MGSRLRRAAGASVALGVSLLVSSTVALAQDPTPDPAPTPAPTVTVAPSPVAAVLATPTATATAALTPEPSPTVAATPTATATAAATATATAAATPAPPTLVERRPQRPARQAATPTPTATPDPGDEGATITICHALGDGTYETVTIVLYSGILDEHFLHEDDLIPAPATGCGPGAQPDELVGVCHATGDPEHPYEFAGFLRPDNLEGHENHPGDLIPAPNGTCPGLDEYFVPTPTPSPEPTSEPTTTPVPTQAPTTEPTPTPTADGTDEGGDEEGDGGGQSPSGGVGGVSAQSSSATASPAYLPFTGFELWLIAAAGLGLTLMGGGLRLLSVQPAVGVTR